MLLVSAALASIAGYTIGRIGAKWEGTEQRSGYHRFQYMSMENQGHMEREDPILRMKSFPEKARRPLFQGAESIPSLGTVCKCTVAGR